MFACVRAEGLERERGEDGIGFNAVTLRMQSWLRGWGVIDSTFCCVSGAETGTTISAGKRTVCLERAGDRSVAARGCDFGVSDD